MMTAVYIIIKCMLVSPFLDHLHSGELMQNQKTDQIDYFQIIPKMSREMHLKEIFQ